MSSGPNIGVCPGCGLELPELTGPTPSLLGASPACWALYGRLLIRQYGGPGDDIVHRLTVASYALQHPGNPPHRSLRPPALHLTVLCLVLEQDMSAQQTTTLLADMPQRSSAPRWLLPPSHNGTLTVADVVAARTPHEHARLVRRWARDVWSLWAPHHAEVRRWIDIARGGGSLAGLE